MKFKKINRKSDEYRKEYAFFYLFYILFSCLIFSITEIVLVNEVISIAVMAIIYSLVNSEIFGRANFGYYSYQAIGVPILVVFVYFQYHINELVN